MPPGERAELANLLSESAAQLTHPKASLERLSRLGRFPRILRTSHGRGISLHLCASETHRLFGEVRLESHVWLTLVDLRVHNPVDTSRGGFLTATEPYDLRKPLVVPGEVRREWIGRVTKPLQSMPGSQHGIGSTSDDFAVELSRELSHLQSCRMDALKQRSQSNADLGSSSADFGAVPSAAGEAPGGKGVDEADEDDAFARVHLST